MNAATKNTDAPRLPFDRSDLWQLYHAALADRNFQVNLNWDRTKHYFLFNVGVLTLAGGIALEQYPAAQLALLALAFFNALLAAHSIARGHEYYRKSRAFLTRIERQLDLIGDDALQSPLAMQTTRGKVREITGQKARLVDRMTITAGAILLQVFIAAISGAALVWRSGQLTGIW